MSVSRDEWKGLSFSKIKKHSKELEEFDGIIPLVLYHHINISNRLDYLRSVGEEYEYKDMEKYRRRMDTEKDILEIIDFVNEYPVFEDIVRKRKK